MNKIQALEKTIYNLENDVYEYSWTSVNSCNCGILAHTICGKLPSEAGVYSSPFCDHSEKGAFAVAAVCMTSDMPLPEVFSSLKESGFSFQELRELEFLENAPIRSRAGMGNYNGHYSDKESLIKYLKSWVEILKDHEVKKPEPVHQPERTRIVYVSVPETIKEQAEQLITN